MNISAITLVLLFALYFIVFTFGFLFGKWYEKMMNIVRTAEALTKKDPSIPIPADAIAKEDITPKKPHVNFLEKKAPLSRVMKYPSAEVIRKRHEEKIEEEYQKNALTTSRSGGSYVPNE